MEKRDQLIWDLEKSFRKTFRMFRKEINQLFEDECTAADFSYLKFIMEKGQVMNSMLSQEFNVAMSHISAVTDRFVQRNLVQRNRAENDRRVVYLSITEEGRKQVQALELRKHEYMERKFKNLEDEDIEELLRLFSKIYD
ncbi:MarR family winged helix-turn-helix transcriptional regulator [Pseudalkalibacillus sp. Hm43]|uniref:MarR family winged helix-turn-helix transcriptional regulator n=1 Tax=Pseudalkalibacillus sp. Hm43 TaxID=3450742 RepID=UPI003F41DF86